MQLLNLNNNYYSGKFAEFIAKASLILKGYRIISSRYSAIRGSSAGEIDIIAKRHHTIVFIEVKKRQTIDLAKEVIFTRQQNRIY
ncbi:MAG: YraN family protein, partial [Alphaproteobacteria bacterium]|nr:YraN family protein [Alphaproteobacteria bacterium]